MTLHKLQESSLGALSVPVEMLSSLRLPLILAHAMNPSLLGKQFGSL